VGDDEEAISEGLRDVGDGGTGWRAYETMSAAKLLYKLRERRIYRNLTVSGASSAKHDALAGDESSSQHCEIK
jgi:hypothetical protein